MTAAPGSGLLGPGKKSADPESILTQGLQMSLSREAIRCFSPHSAVCLLSRFGSGIVYTSEPTTMSLITDFTRFD